MKSPRENVLSFLHVTRPLTQWGIGRSGIRVREAGAYILALTLAVATLGVFLSWRIASSYKKEIAFWQARLSSIADDQAQRVSDWLRERQEDAQVLATHSSVRAVLRACCGAGQLPKHPPGSLPELTAVLDELARLYPYAGVYVLDRDAQVMAQSSRSVPLDPSLNEICRAVTRSGATRIDLVGDAPHRSLMGFAAPVFPEPGTTDAGRPTGQLLGIVLVVSDASQTLFPLVTREAVPTRTGETVLVRREGNDIVYFSPQRYVPAGSLNLRFPLSAAPVPARLALEGRETFVECDDYRGIPVLAATQHIPLAGWGLVRKTDRPEALMNFRRQVVVEWLAAVLLIILMAGLLFFHRRDVMMRVLKQEGEKFRALLGLAPDAIYIIEPSTLRILGRNRKAAKMDGYSDEDLDHLTATDLHPPEDHILLRERFERGSEAGGVLHLHTLQRKDGQLVPVEERQTLVDTGGEKLVLSVVRDITERKRAEQTVLESEERYRTLFENSLVGIYRTTPDGRVLAGNPALVRMLGYSSFEELAGHNLNTSGAGPEYPRSQFMKLMEEQGEVTGLEAVWHKQDGDVLHARENARAIRDNSGKILYYEGTVEDITESKRAEAEHIRLVTAIEQSAEAVVITNTKGDIEYVNPAFTRITGYSREEVLGQNPRILKSGKHDPAFYQQLWATILNGEIWHGELINRRKDGSLYTEQMNIAPVRGARGEVTHFIGTKQDVTARKRLEQQLIQAQKVEAVGRLAGGVAHDFNNLLTIINGHAALLTEQTSPEDPRRDHLKEILMAGERAASLTRQLLAFSRRQLLEPRVLGLNSVLADIEKMLRRLIGEDVELVATLKPDLGHVKVDPGQIEQVVMNLAVNARDAMPEGGKLFIETSNVEIDENYARSHSPMLPGKYVMVAVSDTGCGMDLETQAHIFEPFFTTKEKGRGTGLGLATVYGIVKQSGGFIWVYSEPGRGSTFKIYLPRVEEDVATAEPAEVRAEPVEGSETVLVVEDEGGVRSLVCRTLTSHGYKVLEAAGAAQALQIAEQHTEPIHLLLTDVVMPQSGGKHLAMRLSPLHPETKVLYMSGYTDDAIVRHGILEGGTPFLQKPFAPNALLLKVREVLKMKQGTRQ